MPHASDCPAHNGRPCDCGSEGPLRARQLTDAQFRALPKGAHFIDVNGRETIKLADRATAWAA